MQNDALNFDISLDFHFYPYHKKISTNGSTCHLAGLENTAFISTEQYKISKI